MYRSRRDAGKETVCGRTLDHRMDRSHVQPMVGLYEGVAGLRPLLRRGVGKTHRSRRVGREISQALSERGDLESAGALESRRGACREENAGLLRVDGRRVRVGTRVERHAGQVVGANRTDASPGLVVADKAPSSRSTARTVEHAMASPCLGGYDRREPTLRRQAHSVSPRYPMPGSISKLRTVTRPCRLGTVDRRAALGNRRRRERRQGSTDRPGLGARVARAMRRRKGGVSLQAVGLLVAQGRNWRGDDCLIRTDDQEACRAHPGRPMLE